MNILIWLLVGGLIGWIASMMMRTEAGQGFLINVAVGVVGALLGGWLITPLLGTAPNASDGFYSPLSIFTSLAGAVILLAIVNAVRRPSSH